MKISRKGVRYLALLSSGMFLGLGISGVFTATVDRDLWFLCRGAITYALGVYMVGRIGKRLDFRVLTFAFLAMGLTYIAEMIYSALCGHSFTGLFFGLCVDLLAAIMFFFLGRMDEIIVDYQDLTNEVLDEWGKTVKDLTNETKVANDLRIQVEKLEGKLKGKENGK